MYILKNLKNADKIEAKSENSKVQKEHLQSKMEQFNSEVAKQTRKIKKVK